MKYPYYVEYSDFGSPILRLPEEIGLVTAFLFSDVQQRSMSQDFFLEEINQVLQGEVPYSEVSGNMCCLKIKKDFTTVFDMLAENPGDPGTECMIETEELKNLILVWHQFRRLDSKQRNTDAINRVPASTTDQSLAGNELPTEVREA
jgi:antitoxin